MNCKFATILFLALPFIIFDMFLGDIHCLSHAPFEQTFTIQPQNWQLLCLSVLQARMLNVWDMRELSDCFLCIWPWIWNCEEKYKPTMAKFVSIPFLAVQVPFWCLLTTAKQKEWQIISEKGYGFPWVISSSRLLCRWTVPKVAWKASVSLCMLIICELLVIPEFSVEFIAWIPADVSRQYYVCNATKQSESYSLPKLYDWGCGIWVGEVGNAFVVKIHTVF